MKTTICGVEIELPDDFSAAILATNGNLHTRTGETQSLVSVKGNERVGGIHHESPYEDRVFDLMGMTTGDFVGRVSCNGTAEDGNWFRENVDIKPEGVIASKYWPLVYIGGRRKS